MGNNLLDGVAVGVHGIIRFLHGGKHCLVELVNGFIELGTCQTGGIHQFGTTE